MFTLFFAGDTFAPKRQYNGKSIQQFLNDCFMNAYHHLAGHLVDLDAVLGFEFMNEPHPGYIGLDHLNEFDPIVNLIFGDSPTPLQSFALGDRIPQKVGVYIKSWPFPTKKSHDRIINTSRVSAWLTECVWKEHGVWKSDQVTGDPVLVDSHYFSKHPVTGKKVSFYDDFYVPLVNRYAQTIQSVKQDWYCLVEPLANEVLYHLVKSYIVFLILIVREHLFTRKKIITTIWSFLLIGTTLTVSFTRSLMER
jgi:hypothetical protein